MPYSKRWLNMMTAITLLLIIGCACGLPLESITLAAIGLLATAFGLYEWKAKNENRAKYAQKFMDKWAKDYGSEAAARIAEIVLKD